MLKSCPKVKHSVEGAGSCLDCDKDDPEKKMLGVYELQWQKCVGEEQHLLLALITYFHSYNCHLLTHILHSYTNLHLLINSTPI